jgi:RsiW-degrading membrane proteinase PrsW (M82 family)
VNLPLLLVVSVAAGMLPMLCWAALVWWVDRYEKEPIPLLAVSFLWGVVPAALIATVLEVVLGLLSGYTGSTAPSGSAFFNLGILAPAIEEAVKFLGVIGVFWIAGREIDGPLDGMIYGAMVGFGFAAAENAMFFLTSRSVGELLTLVFLRAMIFGWLHAMFTSFAGLGLAFAKYSRNSWTSTLWGVAGLLLAIFFHAVHNIGLVAAQNSPAYLLLSLLFYGIGVVLILMLSIGSLIRERQTIRRYLQPYVLAGVLRTEQWDAAGSLRARLLAEWKAISELDFKRYRKIGRVHTVCAELAFKEKQRQLWGPEPVNDKEIAGLALEMRNLLGNLPVS